MENLLIGALVPLDVRLTLHNPWVFGLTAGRQHRYLMPILPLILMKKPGKLPGTTVAISTMATISLGSTHLAVIITMRAVIATLGEEHLSNNSISMGGSGACTRFAKTPSA